MGEEILDESSKFCKYKLTESEIIFILPSEQIPIAKYDPGLMMFALEPKISTPFPENSKLLFEYLRIPV